MPQPSDEVLQLHSFIRSIDDPTKKMLRGISKDLPNCKKISELAAARGFSFTPELLQSALSGETRVPGWPLGDLYEAVKGI